ncbi:MAG: DNA polymerase III subunit gamma/tau [Parvibaculum sp.]|uniref:DNA polymerase III subunit gamma/tau n=1 Tax=Parvibaculum sp. TaxID=2024848 RepID=UPI003C731E92
MDDSVENTALEAIANEEPGFALLGGEAKSQPRQQASGYQVLARKYRPSNFDDLVGQEAMVRTLSNAFETGRIAHAFMLTGVRGVGKTTTARILARALNYEKPGVNGPTIHMDGNGVHCEAIMESRHVDVLEMDAASRTGIDDIREIIESVRYLPVSARYKVYIIDEVHMLSKAAFNGLLKTLEEPPAHVKFIFATTEIRKVPVTVLSRCQRFDLRRLSVGELTGLLSRISQKESIAVEEAALKLLARAADGSARDGLSLLDRAIAHGASEGEGDILELAIRDMLGLADRARIFDLFDMLMKGDIAAALDELRAQYDAGADPAVVLSDLADLTHWLTRLKLVQGAGDDMAMSETERVRGQEMASKLPIRTLSRVWQMLLKGLVEVQGASRPIAAAEMVLVRIAYVADGPSPEELIEQLKGGGAVSRPAPSGGAPAGPSGGGPRAQLRTVSSMGEPERRPIATQAVSAAPSINLARFEDVVAFFGAQRDIRMKSTLEAGMRLVRFEQGHIEIQPLEGTNGDIARELSEKLTRASGQRWVVSIATDRAQAAPTLKEQAQTREQALKESAEADPLVQAALAAFPGAVIVNVRDKLSVDLPSASDGEIAHDEFPSDDEMDLDE